LAQQEGDSQKSSEPAEDVAPFASARRIIACMTDRALTQVVEGIRKRPYRGRTDLYRWLRAHHESLAREFATNDPSWQDVTEMLTAVGFVGRFGAPLQAGGVRRVWLTVCRDVATERAAQIEQMTGIRQEAPARSRAPSDWRPPAFAQPNAPSQSRGEHQGSQSAALPTAPLPQQQRAMPPDAEAPKDTSRPVPGTAAAIREMLNIRSGRKPNGDPLF